MAPTSFPGSYTTHPSTELKLSHYPPTSATVTPVIVVTLYRPGKRNAFTGTMCAELVEAFRMLDADPRVKCIVLTGDGDMFCAGADLDVGFKRGGGRPDEHRDGGGRVALAIHNCHTPTIAAIQGSAVGIGITMTLPTNIRVVSKNAKIGFVFARRGLIMEACSSYFLPRLIGHSRALHLVTTGSVLKADDKLLEGLFSEVCAGPKETVQTALRIAEDVVKNCSPVSVGLMKDLMWRGKDSAEGTHLLDSRIIYELFEGKDNAEGVKSFLEKRPANFTGTMADNAPASYPWWDPIDVSEKGDPAKRSKL